MIKIALNGCNGRMGDVIVRCAEKRVDCKIIAGI
ncbi:MAG: 4-hydroxy-tetrahydrodipicolinate reductase, partial [Oscillospiraceae bacterium]|nr:4-hydroxy-tetrahydrodipicolinate reductase [Oscillospiraceae bacterium]